jgi:hypothetical protein
LHAAEVFVPSAALFVLPRSRWSLSLSLALAACGSDVEHEAPPAAAAASGLWCATSFGCPEGERCDGSACVADVGCAPPEAPRVLHHAAAGDPFFDCGGPVRSGDREYFEGCSHAGTIQFVDLRDGGISSLHSAHGSGTCGGEPTHCLLHGEGAQALLLGVRRDTGAWSVDHVVSGLAPATLPDEGDLRAGRALQQRETSVGFVDLASKLYEPWVQLEGRVAQSVVWDWSGVQRIVLTSGHVDGARTFEMAPLQRSGAFRTVLEQSPPFEHTGVALPTVDGWYIAADRGGGDISAMRVWHVTDSTTQLLGDIDSSAAAVAASRYRGGKPRLEDGHIGYALECEAQGDRCRSSRVDFASLAVSPIGEVRIQGAQGLTTSQPYRPLACGGIDALVEEPVFTGGQAEPSGKRYWLVRVPGDAAQ